MNIYTVRDNLKNTIAGKEKMLAEHQCALAASYLGPTPIPGTEMAFVATIKFLETNLDELNRILQDVEVCCQQHNEMGWQINPERMGQ